MRKLFFPLLAIAVCLGVFSCKKTQPESLSPTSVTDNNDVVTGKIGDPDPTCPPTTVTLVAGQTINAGQVTVSSDSAFIYVTYATANGYTLTQTHLYVGDCALIPVNNPGNPVPGQFPYSGTHNNITSYTYQIPLSVLGGATCGCVAAHAVVQKLDAAGHVIDQQTGWGNGTRINLTGGNWGMKFDYCLCQ